MCVHKKSFSGVTEYTIMGAGASGHGTPLRLWGILYEVLMILCLYRVIVAERRVLCTACWYVNIVLLWWEARRRILFAFSIGSVQRCEASVQILEHFSFTKDSLYQKQLVSYENKQLKFSAPTPFLAHFRDDELPFAAGAKSCGKLRPWLWIWSHFPGIYSFAHFVTQPVQIYQKREGLWRTWGAQHVARWRGLRACWAGVRNVWFG